MDLKKHVAVLAVATAFLGACGSDSKKSDSASKSTTTSSTAVPSGATQATTADSTGATTDGGAAAKINLQQSDFPGTDWTANPNDMSPDDKRVNQQLLDCAGIKHTFNPVLSQDFQKGVLELSATSGVQAVGSKDEAAHDFKGLASDKFATCATDMLKKEMGQSMQAQGAQLQNVSMEKTSFPDAGDEVVPYHMTATISQGGQTMNEDVIYVFMRVGKYEMNMGFSAINTTFPKDLASQLTKNVANRAKNA